MILRVGSLCAAVLLDEAAKRVRFRYCQLTQQLLARLQRENLALFVIKKDLLARKGNLAKGKRVKQREGQEVHEKTIGDQFLRALKLEGKFLRHGEDDCEADLLYSLEGKTLGIEIATAFYHNQQAEIESQLALGKFKSTLFGAPRALTNDQDRVIVSNARWELDDKCAQNHAGHEVWLCIELQAPRLKLAEAAQLANAISIPARHNFARIYFGSHALPDGKGFTVLRRF